MRIIDPPPNVKKWGVGVKYVLTPPPKHLGNSGK